jgi:hypothetical protein
MSQMAYYSAEVPTNDGKLKQTTNSEVIDTLSFDTPRSSEKCAISFQPAFSRQQR